MNVQEPRTNRARSQADGLNRKTTETIFVRPAAVDDVPAIVALVNSYARQGTVLPRTTTAVYMSIDDWLVAESGGELLGCVSLVPYSSGLVEVRSLVVQERFQGLGIGRKLMEELLVEARNRQIPRLFALTRIIPFFQRIGFSITDRELFPEKVWRDCLQCPLLDNCDETAMVLPLAAGGVGS